jgi:hypothetical protein
MDSITLFTERLLTDSGQCPQCSSFGLAIRVWGLVH